MVTEKTRYLSTYIDEENDTVTHYFFTPRDYDKTNVIVGRKIAVEFPLTCVEARFGEASSILVACDAYDDVSMSGGWEDCDLSYEDIEKLLNLANVPRKKFETGEELLNYLDDGHDLYCKEINTFIYSYNDYRSVCEYEVFKEEAEKLKILSALYDEYWGGFLGKGGYVYDGPGHVLYEEGEFSNLDCCNELVEAGCEWEVVDP